MRYAQIRKMDISNGSGIGQSIFFQGCDHHCPGCFNQETWDFEGGQEFTPELQDEFIELLNRPYIIRCTLIGGCPLTEQNLNSGLYDFVYRIRATYPEIRLWIYSGYTWEEIQKDPKKMQVVQLCDYLVDGRFEEDKKDLTLEFRGSANQRIIDVQQTLMRGKIIKYTEN